MVAKWVTLMVLVMGLVMLLVQMNTLVLIGTSSLSTTGWRSQYVYHFCDRSQTLSGHILINKRGASQNYAAIDWGTVPQLKSVEFLEAPLLFIGIWPLKV